MSQPKLPTPEAAYQVVDNGVYNRVFFQKLAAAGIVPQTEQDVLDLLEMAKVALAKEQHPTTKSANTSVYGQALADLRGEVEKLPTIGNDRVAQIKAAAAQYAAMPEIYNSMLSLVAYDADQHAAAAAQ